MSEIAFPFVFFFFFSAHSHLWLLFHSCGGWEPPTGRMLFSFYSKLASAGAVMGNWQVGRNSVSPCSLLFLSHLGIDEGGAQWRYSRRISPRQGNWGLLLYPARLGEIWQPKCFIWENILRRKKFTRLSSLVQDMTWHSLFVAFSSKLFC